LHDTVCRRPGLDCRLVVAVARAWVANGDHQLLSISDDLVIYLRFGVENYANDIRAGLTNTQPVDRSRRYIGHAVADRTAHTGYVYNNAPRIREDEIFILKRTVGIDDDAKSAGAGFRADVPNHGRGSQRGGFWRRGVARGRLRSSRLAGCRLLCTADRSREHVDSRGFGVVLGCGPGR